MLKDEVVGVIFDMDGVLIDSEPLAVRSEEFVFAKHQIKVPVRLKRKFKGKRSRDIFEMVNKACCNGSLDIDQLVEERREKYLELADTELTLLPDAIEILTALRGKVLPNGKKFKVGLSTSSSPASQQHAFARFNLGQYFDAVVTATDVKQGKPHPRLTWLRRRGLVLGRLTVSSLKTLTMELKLRVPPDAKLWR